MTATRTLIFLCIGLLTQLKIHAEETAKNDSLPPKFIIFLGAH